jgi:hypothetical protein
LQVGQQGQKGTAGVGAIWLQRDSYHPYNHDEDDRRGFYADHLNHACISNR